eukprot:scaffold165849_cov46-Prasinocladus_malaysianus.AAC.1
MSACPRSNRTKGRAQPDFASWLKLEHGTTDNSPQKHQLVFPTTAKTTLMIERAMAYTVQDCLNKPKLHALLGRETRGCLRQMWSRRQLACSSMKGTRTSPTVRQRTGLTGWRTAGTNFNIGIVATRTRSFDIVGR